MENLNNNLPKISVAGIQKSLLFLEFLQSLSEFDADSVEIENHFDDIKAKMYREFLDQEGKFQYDIFFSELLKIFGPRFKYILLGYSAMVEMFCKPGSPALEINENIIRLDEGNLLLKVDEVCKFVSFQMWVNKAIDWIGSFDPNEKIVSIDKFGNSLNNGKDFQHARDTDAFPVTCYRLKRNTEEKLVKSIHNN